MVKTKRTLTKAQKTIAVSKSCGKMLTEKVFSLTEELLSVHVESASLRVDLDEVTGRVQRMLEDFGKHLSNVFSMKVQKSHDDMIDVVEQKMQKNLEDGWK